MIIRRGLHALGWRYRLHVKDLPGKPDLVFPARKAVIMVQGCFWHGHDCALFRWPSTRKDFWRDKIGGNVRRDRKVRDQLAQRGWRVIEVWECTMKGKNRRPVGEILGQCTNFLEGSEPFVAIGGARTVNLDDGAGDDGHSPTST